MAWLPVAGGGVGCGSGDWGGPVVKERGGNNRKYNNEAWEAVAAQCQGKNNAGVHRCAIFSYKLVENRTQ